MQTHTIAPQSIAEIKKATLTPHFDPSSLQLSCEQSKTSLFTYCRPEDIELIFSENYYEPYFIIKGKHTVDYTKKHLFTVELDENIDKLYIAGNEILSQPTDSKKAIFEIPAEQRVHHQNEIVLVLDKRSREVDEATISFSTCSFEDVSESQNWPEIDVPTNVQIDLLSNKITMRPPDSALIENEILEITQRTIVYLPMCSFTFENLISHEEATVTLDRVTGKIDSISYKKNRRAISAKLPGTIPHDTQPISNLQPTLNPSFIQDEIEGLRKTQSNNAPEISLMGVPESTLLGFPAEIGGETFSVGGNVTAVVGDIAIASGSIIDKSLVVKGSIKIGDNCLANGKLKALRDVVVGTETVIDGDIIAGGSVFIGALSTVKGRIEAAGFVRINEGATVEKGLRCFSDDLEFDKRNLEKLREEVSELKAECAELNECLQIGVLSE
jgi:hypothetical protein